MPFELEGSAEHSDLRHGFGGLTCGAAEMERRVRAAHAFSAEMQPHLAAGCTIAQACAAVQRAHRAARAGGGHGGGDGDEDSSDDEDSVMASIDC